MTPPNCLPATSPCTEPLRMQIVLPIHVFYKEDRAGGILSQRTLLNLPTLPRGLVLLRSALFHSHHAHSRKPCRRAYKAWRRHAYDIDSILSISGILTAEVGIFLFHPSIPNYPKAKFPGVVVFSEIYQGMPFPKWRSSKALLSLANSRFIPLAASIDSFVL